MIEQRVRHVSFASACPEVDEGFVSPPPKPPRSTPPEDSDHEPPEQDGHRTEGAEPEKTAAHLLLLIAAVFGETLHQTIRTLVPATKASGWAVAEVLKAYLKTLYGLARLWRHALRCAAVILAAILLGLGPSRQARPRRTAAALPPPWTGTRFLPRLLRASLARLAAAALDGLLSVVPWARCCVTAPSCPPGRARPRA